MSVTATLTVNLLWIMHLSVYCCTPVEQVTGAQVCKTAFISIPQRQKGGRKSRQACAEDAAGSPTVRNSSRSTAVPRYSDSSLHKT